MIEKHSLTGAITSEDVLGKDVIDARGAFIGVSDKLYLHPKTVKVLALSVDKGFLRSGLIIGAAHIKEVTEHAVFLTIEPSFRLKGMMVFGKEGGRVGIVQEIVLVPNTNSVDSLKVKSVKSGVGVLTIPASLLGRMEDNVLLTVTAEEMVRRATAQKKP